MALKPVQAEANRSERKRNVLEKDFRDMSMSYKARLMSKVNPNCIGQSKEGDQSGVTINEWTEIEARRCIGMIYLSQSG